VGVGFGAGPAGSIDGNEGRLDAARAHLEWMEQSYGNFAILGLAFVGPAEGSSPWSTSPWLRGAAAGSSTLLIWGVPFKADDPTLTLQITTFKEETPTQTLEVIQHAKRHLHYLGSDR
jgi:hypothetical protein